jgi:LuxR family transcriptional regulator
LTGRAKGEVTLGEFAPLGHYIALRIGFAFPLSEQNALPEPWVDHYTQHGLMVHDPVIRWVYGNTGAIRWSEITLPDPKGVLEAARRFGLGYGAAISCADDSPDCFRSFGTFVRADREFTDDELAALARIVRRLHDARAQSPNVTSAELEALSLVRDGFLTKEIASRLGVSEGAVKQRLRNVRAKLGAKNGSQAVSIALRQRLI